jgi:hypothetical protein
MRTTAPNAQAEQGSRLTFWSEFMRAHLKPLLLFISVPVTASLTFGVDAQTTPTASAASSVLASPVAQSVAASVSSQDQTRRSQAFHQTRQCLERSLAVEHLQNATRLCNEQPLGSAGRASCEKQTKAEDVRTLSLRAGSSDASCGQDAGSLQQDFSNTLVQAARAGDADAQLCYFEWAGPLSTKDDVLRYQREASLYMQKAMARGDWRMVQLLATSPESVAHGGAGVMGNLDIIGKWFTVYRADRLLQQGATGDYRQVLQTDASEAARHLTSTQISNADTWAQQEFTRHFTLSPPLSAAPVPCLHPGSATP